MTAPPEDGHFVTHLTGQDDRRFTTLQAAVDHMVARPRQTGTIVYVPDGGGADGRTVVTVVDGEIQLVGGHR